MTLNVSLVFVCLSLVGSPAFATVAATPQTENSQAQPLSDEAVLADGWSRLAKGDASGAAQDAARVLAANPLSVAAAALAVEAGLASGGWKAGLTAYDRWMATRHLDDGYLLRRIARAALVETSQKTQDLTAKLEALRALAADGDGDAAAALESASAGGGFAETRELAANGDEAAVKRLIARLASTPAKGPIIDALAQSGSRLAVQPLTTLLSDPSDSNRAAAADGLGRLGATDAIPQLQALLKDPVFSVKLKAAGALYQLNDSSGVAFLNEVAASEHSAIRVAAAAELAAHPDASWEGMVRDLTADPDPVVRMQAAKLIAPYDQPLAKRVLDELMRSDNVGIREAASEAVVAKVANDLATLRQLLRSADDRVLVQASGRILELTR